MKNYLNLDHKPILKLKPFRTLFYLIIFLITLAGCESDSAYQIPLTQEQQLQQSFSLDNFKDTPALQKGDLIIDWTFSKVRKFDSSLFYEFSVAHKNPSILNIDGYAPKASYRLLARFDEDRNPEYFLAELLPSIDTVVKDISYLDILDYSGMVYLYDLKGKKIARESYERGVLQLKSVGKGIGRTLLPRQPLKCAILEGLEEVNCSGGGGCSTSTVTVRHWEYFYDVTYYQNTGTIIDVTYSHRESRGQTVQHITNCSPTTTPAATHTNAESATVNPPEVLSNQLDTDGLAPPDCKSFKYKKVSDDWKATVAKGLNFKVRVLIDRIGNEFTIHDIDFENELFTFQTWIVDRFENELSDADAATVSAFAVDQAIKRTNKELKHRYGVGRMQIEQHFKSVLKKEFALYTGGGRVNTGNQFGLEPIDFEHTWYGYGDCK